MAATNGKTGNTVIFGIDFGTTYSGVAFTWSKKIERMQVISSWESELHSSFNEKKVPTVISFGRKNMTTWGYNIAFDADQARWFKLLLIDDEDLPEDVRNSAKINEARQYLSKHNKTATEVAALFLRQLWNHTIQRITESVSRNVLNYSKFHIVITLPAIWPAYACTRMKEVATLAGMLAKRGVRGDTELSFISEPEAAALATLSDMEGRCDIKADDSFVVVDCGGGTVDLISYEVVSILPMVVKECVKGQGGLCGSVFVDEAFTSVLKREFGKKQWARMSADSRHDLHEKWELGIKRSFDGDEKIWKFTVPFECLDKKAVKAIQARNPLPKITITDNDIRGAFDMVLGKILQMLDEQVQAVRWKKLKNPKYVILVGGFGRCKYLFTAIKQHLGNGIEVLQSRDEEPWTAICRGAVIHASSLRGLSAFAVEVQARVARISCGIQVHQPWCALKHDPVDKHWDEARQSWKARNQMSWFLQIGDEVSPNKPVRAGFERLYDTEKGNESRIAEVNILTSTALPVPPKKNASVDVLCTIKWEAEVDFSSLPTYTNPLGKVFYRLDFDVEMTCAGGLLDFAVYHGGKRQGSKHVAVDYAART